MLIWGENVKGCFAEIALGGFEKITYKWTRWKSVRRPLSAEYMHIGATQMRF